MEHDEDYLCHHGVKGMKWGRRKQRVSSGRSRTSKKSTQIKAKASSVKKNLKKKFEQIDKEKVKKVAKTSAAIAGGVAVAALLGTAGQMAYNNIPSVRRQLIRNNWYDYVDMTTQYNPYQYRGDGTYTRFGGNRGSSNLYEIIKKRYVK